MGTKHRFHGLDLLEEELESDVPSAQFSENAGGLVQPAGDDAEQLLAGHVWIYM